MAIETTRFDIQDFIKNPEDQAGYLVAVLDDGDPGLIAVALGDIAPSPWRIPIRQGNRAEPRNDLQVASSRRQPHPGYVREGGQGARVEAFSDSCRLMCEGRPEGRLC